MKSVITGISSQDSAYLANALRDKGHEVVGLVRSSNSDIDGLKYLKVKGVDIKIIDLCNKQNLIEFIKSYHCCPKRFSSITNFIDFTGRKGYKNAFCDFDPSFI